ncbi:MAG: prepilin-type N-terminal cleavage/methylation domain-containing protein [Burkholderiales bacterium]|nr:prepilin-type N-terminal cleavage/methylation domain-containing protein [Burkholderiales bacterium]
MVRRARPSGFTLVEVMVALVIMAVLSALAMRGMDALMRAKDAALASTDRTLKLNTGMSQFEYDMAMVVDSKVLPKAIMFDGATLRIARRTPQGIELVLWTLQDHRWQRWASAPVVHLSELTDAWMRSQQWGAISGGAITVLDNVDDFQVYVCNPAAVNTPGCSWNNVQSTQGAGGGNNPQQCPQGQQPPCPQVAAPQPDGIRIVLKVPEGEIMRERQLPRFGT